MSIKARLKRTEAIARLAGRHAEADKERRLREYLTTLTDAELDLMDRVYYPESEEDKGILHDLRRLPPELMFERYRQLYGEPPAPRKIDPRQYGITLYDAQK